MSRLIAVLAQTPTPSETFSLTSRECDQRLVCRLLENWTGDEELADMISRFTDPFIEAVVIIVVTMLLLRFARRLIRRSVERMKNPESASWRDRFGPLAAQGPPSPRRVQRAESIGALMRSVVSAVIWTVAVMMILGSFGLNLAPLIAGAGIIGIALGFGAQDLVKDFISGMFMIAEDQYGVGDIVDVGEASGVVESITLRTTKLRDVFGTLWHVPNGEIRRVGNKSQEWARLILDVGVAYDTDIDKASEVILRVSRELDADPEFDPLIIEEPELWGVENFGENEVTLRLAAKVAPGEQWRVARALRRRLKYAFDEANIEIPFPQRTLWVKRDEDVLGE